MARRSYQPPKAELSEAQQAVIGLLLQGNNAQEAGDSVGVDRATVAAWRKSDDEFKAELARRRFDLWGSQIERLRSLVNLAVGVLESDLKNTDDLRLRQAAAVHILRAVKLYGEINSPDGRITESRFNFDL